MVLVEFKERLNSADTRKRLGKPTFYGEKMNGNCYYGQEPLKVTEDEYGAIYFGSRFYGDSRTYEGIYQTRHYKGGKYTVQEKFYSPTETLARTSDPNRITFRNAVLAWQALTLEEKKVYNIKSYGKNMSGYNLFLHEYLISH